MTTRRSFLTACIATVAAPAIVRASSLMPVKVRIPQPYGRMTYVPFMNAVVWYTHGSTEVTMMRLADENPTGFKIVNISSYGQSESNR